MSFLFGGSKQKQTSSSSSSNLAYPQISGQASPLIDSGNGASSVLNSLLGIPSFNPYQQFGGGYDPVSGTMSYGGSEGTSTSGADGLSSWLNNSGYNWVRDQGMKGLEGSYASKGMPSSGAAAKALTKYSSGLANTYLQQYISNLQDQQKMGLGAMGTLAGAGQVSSSTGTSSGSSNNGAGSAIGTALALFAMSDRRLKEDVVRIGELPNGLPVYSFKYVGRKTRNVGVMADEVEKTIPSALGPVIDGYQSVDYGKVPGFKEFYDAL